jgi:hypothetical protein
MKIIFIIYFTVIGLDIFGQQINTPLTCKGEIPEDLRVSTYDKMIQDIDKESSVTKNTFISYHDRDFFLKSNYLLNDLLLSGQILFGDSITEYINNVADILLENDPELRKKIRFYTVKSTDANAFATDPGMIFVTIGLISRLKNEAQLAFVLAHEIIHFKNRHIINKFRHGNTVYKSSREEEANQKVRRLSDYSKENELEADSIGFNFLINSRYSTSEALSTLDILQYSHLPLEQIQFSSSDFENESFHFPTVYKLEKTKEIDVQNDTIDDTYSTHPNISKRKEKLTNFLSRSGSNGLNFIQDEQLFYKIKNLARKEFLFQLTFNGDYKEALYNSYSLIKQNPSAEIFQNLFVKNLYALAKSKTYGGFSSAGSSYDKEEGLSQQAYYFMEMLSTSEINSIAVVEAFQYFEKTKDSFIKKLLDDLIEDQLNIHNSPLSSVETTCKYFDIKKDSMINAIASYQFSDSTTALLDKVKNENKLHELSRTISNSFHLIFYELIKNKEFVNYYLGIENKINQKKISDSVMTNELSDKLPIYKMIIIDPDYFEADNRKGIELLNSEKGKKKFAKGVLKCVNAADITGELLSSQKLKRNEIDKFNDLALLNSYFEEWMNKSSGVKIMFQSEYTDKLTNKYGTNYFNYSGLATLKSKRENKGSILFFGVLNWPILPVAVGVVLTPIFQTEYTHLIFDLSQNKIVHNFSFSLKARSSLPYIKSQIYYDLIKLK